jgi:hypothetical protein
LVADKVKNINRLSLFADLPDEVIEAKDENGSIVEELRDASWNERKRFPKKSLLLHSV